MTPSMIFALCLGALMLAAAIFAAWAARALVTYNRERRPTPSIDRKVEYGLHDFDRRVAALLYDGDPR
jgi:hypothetical protein